MSERVGQPKFFRGNLKFSLGCPVDYWQKSLNLSTVLHVLDVLYLMYVRTYYMHRACVLLIRMEPPSVQIHMWTYCMWYAFSGHVLILTQCKQPHKREPTIVICVTHTYVHIFFVTGFIGN